MDNLKLNNPGGLLAYQDVLAALQQNQSAAIVQLLKAVGDNVIVAGCEVAGDNIAPGIIILNGEILPFEGGTNLGFVKVKEASTERVYKDGVMRPLYYKRTAIPSDAGVAFADLFRIETIKELTKKLGKKSDRYDLDDSNTLATSKAVNDSIKRYVILQGWSKIVGNGGNDSDSTYTTSIGQFGLLDGASNGIRLQISANIGHTNYSVMGMVESASPEQTAISVNLLNYNFIEKTAAGFKISTGLVNCWYEGLITSVFWSVTNNQTV